MAPFHKILFPVDFSTASHAMVPYVREMTRVCAAQLAVLHSFDLVRGYNLAGRLDMTGESARSPVPYTASVAGLPMKKTRIFRRSFARDSPTSNAGSLWKTAIQPPSFTGWRNATV